MRSFLRITGGVCLAALVASLGWLLYLQVRGGFYPSYPSAAFSNLSTPAVSGHGAADPVAQTEAGALRGTYAGSVTVFKGIPFARPPIGELRWEPPQPAMPCNGVRDATRPGSPGVQSPAGLSGFFAPMAKAYGSTYEEAPVQSSEDCLYLNVWAPEWPANRALPVMVWLHGGSNMAGSGAPC